MAGRPNSGDEAGVVVQMLARNGARERRGRGRRQESERVKKPHHPVRFDGTDRPTPRREVAAAAGYLGRLSSGSGLAMGEFPSSRFRIRGEGTTKTHGCWNDDDLKGREEDPGV